MLHKKTIVSAVLILGIALTGLQAQSLFVKEKGGTQTSLALNEIHKLSFADGNLTVTKINGIPDIYAISNIRYLSFIDYDFGIGISEHKLQQGKGILLYPNPAEDLLQVRYESSIPDKMQISITDVQGRLIKQIEQNCQSGTNNSIIDVTGLQCGFYICRLQSGNKTETSRFVKKYY